MKLPKVYRVPTIWMNQQLQLTRKKVESISQLLPLKLQQTAISLQACKRWFHRLLIKGWTKIQGTNKTRPWLFDWTKCLKRHTWSLGQMPSTPSQRSIAAKTLLVLKNLTKIIRLQITGTKEGFQMPTTIYPIFQHHSSHQTTTLLRIKRNWKTTEYTQSTWETRLTKLFYRLRRPEWFAMSLSP